MKTAYEKEITVLDCGYVKYVDHMGSDESIIEAARMSTGRGFNGWGTKEKPGDERLLAYLYNNKHSTPFEMGNLCVEVKAPIFVYREWHRHRTQSYNEMSARYIPLPDETYMPTTERLLLKDTHNKQAQSTGAALDEQNAKVFQDELVSLYHHVQEVYEKGIAMGVPKELARLAVPVARYSRMRASANVRNWLQFLTLRMDPHAQWEIQQYANAVHAILVELFPHTMELFDAERTK